MGHDLALCPRSDPNFTHHRGSSIQRGRTRLPFSDGGCSGTSWFLRLGARIEELVSRKRPGMIYYLWRSLQTCLVGRWKSKPNPREIGWDWRPRMRPLHIEKVVGDHRFDAQEEHRAGRERTSDRTLGRTTEGGQRQPQSGHRSCPHGSCRAGILHA